MARTMTAAIRVRDLGSLLWWLSVGLFIVVRMAWYERIARKEAYTATMTLLCFAYFDDWWRYPKDGAQ